MPPSTLLVLVHQAPGTPRPPDRFAIGRAALALRQEGVRVLFGSEVRDGRASGLEATPAGWVRRHGAPVLAAQDRMAGPAQEAAWLAAIEGLAGRPVGNPPRIKRLARDKLECQRTLEAGGVEMPEVEGDAARFEDRLLGWGAAFLKPRTGSRGFGVARVAPGDDLSRAGGPWILQAAISPPPGVAGISVRQLVQREPSGAWFLCEPVARISAVDPVAGVERGARAAPGSELLGKRALASMREQATRIAEVLAAGPEGVQAVEFGLDFAIDQDGMPHLIEVNGVPRGRLDALAAQDAARWGAAAGDAALRPLRRLLALVG